MVDVEMGLALRRNYEVLKFITWGRQSRIEECVCEWSVACEPAVEDEEAGAIAGNQRSENCFINYL